MTRFCTAIAALAVIASIAACARPVTTRNGAGGRTSFDAAKADPALMSGDKWTSCRDHPAPYGEVVDKLPDNTVEWPPLAADFTPVAAMLCTVGFERRSDGGEDQVLTESKATEINVLVAAYRLPDEQGTVEACDAVGVFPPDVAFVNAQGHWVRPRAPLNLCSQPRTEVLEAARTVPKTMVRKTVLREVVSAGAARTGCSQQWGDMVWSVSQSSGATPVGPGSAPGVKDDIRICVYEVPASEMGSGKPAGSYVEGAVVTVTEFAPLRVAIEATGPAEPCQAEAEKFAVVGNAERSSDLLYIELNGCRRIMHDTVADTGKTSEVFSQGDLALATLLTSLTS